MYIGGTCCPPPQVGNEYVVDVVGSKQREITRI
jgi:hypothetical protein